MSTLLSEGAVLAERWFRAFGRFAPVPGTSRSRPATWWASALTQHFGRPITPAEIRQALVRVSGARLGPDGDRTNVLAGASFRQADRYALANPQRNDGGRS